MKEGVPFSHLCISSHTPVVALSWPHAQYSQLITLAIYSSLVNQKATDNHAPQYQLKRRKGREFNRLTWASLSESEVESIGFWSYSQCFFHCAFHQHLSLCRLPSWKFPASTPVTQRGCQDPDLRSAAYSLEAGHSSWKHSSRSVEVPV